jgi:drug/metabolite transporter (DMT)-like permease
VAGILLIGILFLLKKNESLTLKDVAKQVLPGIILITIGNGVVGWAEVYIPSGLAALIVSIIPIYIFVISLFVTPWVKLSGKSIAGLILGGLGIVLIFKDNLKDLGNEDYLYGILACFGSSLFWAIGSVYMKVVRFNTSPYTNAAIQFISGGIGLLIASLLFDDYSQLSAITNESLLALLYLTLVGSLLSYLAYLFAIEHLPIVMVASYAYVNPVIAILLGYLIISESITLFTVLALVAALCGVYLINSAHRKKAQPIISKKNIV